MDRLKRNIHFITAFKSTSAKQSLLLLKHITPEQSQVLGDIAANLLKKTLLLSKGGKEKLSKYKEFVYCIGDGETTHAHRIRCIKKDHQAALTLIEVTTEKLQRLCNNAKKK